MALVKKVKTGLWETLCHVTRCCGKNRRVRLREKSAARYQEHLDIRSFVSVETNLTLLLSLLLNRQQLTLFKSNQMRALLDKDDTKEKLSISSSDDDCSNSNDLFKLHLKAPKLSQDKHKRKLFDDLLGFPVDSSLDLKLV